MSKKLTAGYVIKTAVCAIVFLGVMAAFSYVCCELANNYLILLIPTTAASISWLIRLGVFVMLLAIMLGVTAVLLRPLWLVALIYVLAAVVYPLVVGSSQVTWIAAGVFFIFLLIYFLAVVRSLKNQVNFSIHPLSDMKLLLFSLLAALVCVAFGFGYNQDAMRRAYIIPPEIKTLTADALLSQAKGAIEKQPATAAQKKAALGVAHQKALEMIDGWEKQAKPFARFIPIIISVILFLLLQMVFLLLGFVSLIFLKPLFMLLRLTRFANVAVETREVKHLTLESVIASEVKK